MRRQGITYVPTFFSLGQAKGPVGFMTWTKTHTTQQSSYFDAIVDLLAISIRERV
jgi:hypothetical protein